MPSLCSSDTQRRSLRSPSDPSAVDQVLGDDEGRDALGPGRGARHPGQHQVDDVLGQVVVAVGDEDLLARDAPGPVAVVGGNGPGAQGADVGAGLGLGQVHGAGPLPGHHLLQVGRLLLGRAVVGQHVDGALVEQRAQGERHVGARQDLLDGDGHHPGEAAAAEGGLEGDGTPAGVDVRPVGITESGRGDDVARVVEDAADLVADPVEGGEDLGQEAARLLDDPVAGVGVGVAVGVELGQAGQVDDVVEDEADVAKRRGIVSRHGDQATTRLGRAMGTGLGILERGGPVVTDGKMCPAGRVGTGHG